MSVTRPFDRDLDPGEGDERSERGRSVGLT